MESRMEKYNEINIEEFQRSKKNANLYKEVYGNYGPFEDLPIPENTNEIDIENLKSLVGNSKSKRGEFIDNKEVELEEEILNLPKEDKVYDINALLEKAKEENAKIKKETPLNRNIPNYLANLESDKITKDIILKYDGDNDDDDLPIVKEVKYSTTEIALENNVVNTSTLSLDILSDLKPTGNTMISEPLKEELENIEQEKEFFDDNKVKFLKDDFDDIEDEEDDNDFFAEEKEHIFLKILLIIIGLASIFTVAFFIIKEYTNIF